MLRQFRKQGLRALSWRYWLVAGLAVAIVLGLLATWTLRPPAGETAEAPAAAEPERDSPVIRVSAAKIAAMDLRLAPAEFKPIQEERRVPGRVGYNESRRLEVKMPVEGVVAQVLARPGQAVKKGERLAVLASTGVGLARDALVKSKADLGLAHREWEWAEQVAVNLQDLLARLEDRPEVSEIERDFRTKRLGEHRDRILAAYSRLLLAQRTFAASEQLDGALSGLTIRERQSAKDVASATFAGTCEQSQFDVGQRRAAARADLEQAERRVAINRQKLQIQLGPFAQVSATPSDSALCEVELNAAMDGIVEERLVTDGSQFLPSQTLFVLSNLDTVWVFAQVFEREWAGMNEQELEEVTVECPAVSSQPLAARMLYVSAVTSRDSRAVPLVAELPNPDGRFKPGMFAWVTVPFGAPRRVLVVPSSAVTRHEKQAIVFAEQSPGVYRRLDVSVGIETPEQVEILSGLEAGQNVVVNGAFLLKSELLLQGEQE